MPKQMRGFWNCEHCGRPFDEYPAASYHESYDCPRNPAVAAVAAPLPSSTQQQQQQYQYQPQQSQPQQYQQYQRPSQQQPYQPQQYQYQQPPPQYRFGATPSSHPQPSPPQSSSHDPYDRNTSTSNTTASTTMEEDRRRPRSRQQQPHDRVMYRREQPSASRASAASVSPQSSSRGAAADSSSSNNSRRHLFWRSPSSSDTTAKQQQQEQAQTTMEEADVIACRSIEVFEVDNSNAFPAAPSSPAVVDSRGVRIRPTVGQVGLRCIHCCIQKDGDDAQPATAAVVGVNTVFPVNVHEIGSGIRQISESHLVSCTRAPRQACQSLEQALQRRRASQAEALGDGSVEGGNVAAARFQQEEYRRLLLDYCAERVRELDLVDYEPPPGIIFRTRAVTASATAPGDAVAAARYYASPGSMSQQQHQGLATASSTDQQSVSPLSRSTERALAMNMLNMPPTPPSFGDVRRSPHHQPPVDRAAQVEDRMASAEPLPVPQLQQRQQQRQSQPRQSPPPPPPQELQQQQRPSPEASMHDNMPANFPFRREPGGDWICKFCQHVPAQYRDHQYRWAAGNRSPPPAHFIDHHLNQCRMYQQSLLQDVHQDIPAHVGFPFHAPLSTSSTAQQQQQPQYHQQQQQQQQQQQPQYSHHHLAHTQQIGRGMPGWESAMVASVGTQPAAVSGGGGDYYNQYGMQMSASTMRGPYGGAGRQLPGMERPGGAGTPSDQAIEHLRATDLSEVDTDGTPLPEESKLVLEEDRLLLTDYFYYLMKQLRLVRFSESDRKTRGGKREKIQVGYGGLQCVHCATQSNARKFFWSNVDRLANSFAEIPAHVLKCRSCPERTKNALLTLKDQHPDQMTRLPRGSQKVFFRRMWRRLHDQDPVAAAPMATSPQASPASIGGPTQPSPMAVPTSPTLQDRQEVSLASATAAPPTPAGTSDTSGLLPSSPGTSKSDESTLLLERTTVEAAKALAESMNYAGPPSPTSRVLLAIPEDSQWLSDHDCFIRRQIEVFCATKDDIETARVDRKYPVVEGQVGIRCIHCAIAKGGGANGQAVSYPFSVGAIYESVREFHRLHLYECEHLPPSVKSKLSTIRGSSSLSSVLRKYYVLSARCLGLVDTKDGIRAGGETAPLGSQAAFSFADSSPTAGMETSIPPFPPPAESESRKRPRPDDSSSRDDEGDVQDSKPTAR